MKKKIIIHLLKNKMQFLMNKFIAFWSNFFRIPSPDSARSMLSAIVQSESTILAIVITLSLVVVQLTSSSYSPKAIEFFMKSPIFWTMIGLYIMTISYNLGLLKKISNVAISNMEKRMINSAYFLSAICFLALIPYTLYTISLLKPSTIINKLSQQITKKNLIIEGKEDPIVPVIYIVRSSIIKNDYETARDGLNAIGSRLCNLFQKEKFSNDDETKISEKVNKHFLEVTKLAISRDDELSILALIDNIYSMSKVMIEKGLEDAAVVTIYSLEEIGWTLVKKGLEHTAVQAIGDLEILGEDAAKKELGHATHAAVSSVGMIGRSAADRGFFNIAWQAAWSLGIIGIPAARHRLKNASEEALGSLGYIGKITAEKELREASMQAASSLIEIWQITTEKNLRDSLWYSSLCAVWSLEEIGLAATKNGLEKNLWQVVLYLQEIDLEAAEKGLEDETYEATRSLVEIWRTATEKGLLKGNTNIGIGNPGEIKKIARNKGFSQKTISMIAKACNIIRGF